MEGTRGRRIGPVQDLLRTVSSSLTKSDPSTLDRSQEYDEKFRKSDEELKVDLAQSASIVHKPGLPASYYITWYTNITRGCREEKSSVGVDFK